MEDSYLQQNGERSRCQTSTAAATQTLRGGAAMLRSRRFRATAPAVVDFNQTDASAVVRSREQRGVRPGGKRRGYAGLQCVCRRETRRSQFRRLSRVILPVVIRDQERSVAVAQFQRWIGQGVGHPGAVRLGPIPRTTILSSPLLPPRMKPAITMSFPVPTKARVLILASFDENCLTEVVDFNQADPGGVAIAPHDRGIGSGIQGRIDR